MVNSNFEKQNGESKEASMKKPKAFSQSPSSRAEATTGGFAGFDSLNIEERMKRLRFARKDNLPLSKDPNWFKKVKEVTPSSPSQNRDASKTESAQKMHKLLNMKTGLTDEDERKI